MASAVKEQIYKLVDKELAAANKKFPLFASPHEAYAVLLEEIEEAEERVQELHGLINEIWCYTRSNEAPVFIAKLYLEALQNAQDLAIEAIQCAAMARKAIISFEMKEKSEENE